jgi:phage terminase large subunit-like protein
MTDAERSAFDAHAGWLHKLLADGVLIVAGPCLGQVNTGIAIFEAPDEQTARRIVASEPVTSGRTGSACCAAVTGGRREAGMKVVWSHRSTRVRSRRAAGDAGPGLSARRMRCTAPDRKGV